MKKNVIELRDVARRFAPAYVAGRGEAIPCDQHAVTETKGQHGRAMRHHRGRAGARRLLRIGR